MNSRILLPLLLLLALSLTACQSSKPEVSILTGEIAVLENPYAPAEKDSGKERTQAYLDALTATQSGNQLTLTFKGSLPTPCHELRLNLLPTDAPNQLEFEAYSVIDPEKMCAQVIQEFEASVLLGGLPAGEMLILVNGQEMQRVTIAP